MSIRLSIEALEVLDAIDREGSFSAAAESLHRVPSAITYTIRTLEDDLDIKLFDRSGHKAKLTAAGLELLREGRHLLKAAGELERRVRRVATGIETDIRIAISDLLRLEPLYDILDRFYRQAFGTRVYLQREVYGGSWDALISNRADISIGAPGEGPSGGGYTTRLLGTLEFVFAIAPHHPLADLPEPLSNHDIQQHRSISAADSSRHLPPKTSGILDGQDVLSVPDIPSKALAQIKGLGVGYLPRKLAEYHAARGELLIREVAEPKPEVVAYVAWRSGGKAQQWLLQELQKVGMEAFLPG
ncbi:LysR family transcriptional regulator [Methylobacillus flagellatus]|uniref:Transcriptional regulator, LysR family n=1 Tax=Methylobacillus flagellatus (strain ATCC 51484 / DSM 6875 / VKM B-1610 / KT) TaxID=265072 RepID=Q1H085_METFK|nr:LysR family transcriptional regulator [Methylobacillus flagellatus]ABE50102.1 transcriptional regulator, LysR family [Methylobacillus flagellatus KT]